MATFEQKKKQITSTRKNQMHELREKEGMCGKQDGIRYLQLFLHKNGITKIAFNYLRTKDRNEEREKKNKVETMKCPIFPGLNT